MGALLIVSLICRLQARSFMELREASIGLPMARRRSLAFSLNLIVLSGTFMASCAALFLAPVPLKNLYASSLGSGVMRRWRSLEQISASLFGMGALREPST